jgi:hypothetical protein
MTALSCNDFLQLQKWLKGELLSLSVERQGYWGTGLTCATEF